MAADIRRIARALRAHQPILDATLLRAQLGPGATADPAAKAAPDRATTPDDRGLDLARQILSLPIEAPGDPRRLRKARLLEMLADLQDEAVRGTVKEATLTAMFDQLAASVTELSSGS
ncbi:hypothetical protein CKO28_04910 [Rhodovibrio sodomensis]|uniref:Uncharacterized protein n=1 Tax=Rhodovibrio sodomensis TaxID=1088 RepID=A0ABS1DBU5_9PROT|nr:hypothetical protein [Rhodovibrio sodomensis]MBK1667369.1 hypothetical protein [Rhodovibrio sodomensis]